MEKGKKNQSTIKYAFIESNSTKHMKAKSQEQIQKSKKSIVRFLQDNFHYQRNLKTCRWIEQKNQICVPISINQCPVLYNLLERGCQKLEKNYLTFKKTTNKCFLIIHFGPFGVKTDSELKQMLDNKYKNFKQVKIESKMKVLSLKDQNLPANYKDKHNFSCLNKIQNQKAMKSHLKTTKL